MQLALPLLFAIGVWWFSTGVILYLDGLPRRTFKWTLLGTTVLLFAALVLRGRPVPPALGATADALLGNLGLLFDPAGVGVVLYLPLLARD